MAEQTKKGGLKNLFTVMDYKTMLQFNVVSIIITAICVIFAVNILLTKGQQPEIEEWKYIAIIIGVVIVSLMFIGSLVSMFLFIRMKNKKKQ